MAVPALASKEEGPVPYAGAARPPPVEGVGAQVGLAVGAGAAKAAHQTPEVAPVACPAGARLARAPAVPRKTKRHGPGPPARQKAPVPAREKAAATRPVGPDQAYAAGVGPLTEETARKADPVAARLTPVGAADVSSAAVADQDPLGKPRPLVDPADEATPLGRPMRTVPAAPGAGGPRRP